MKNIKVNSFLDCTSSPFLRTCLSSPSHGMSALRSRDDVRLAARWLQLAVMKQVKPRGGQKDRFFSHFSRFAPNWLPRILAMRDRGEKSEQMWYWTSVCTCVMWSWLTAALTKDMILGNLRFFFFFFSGWRKWYLAGFFFFAIISIEAICAQTEYVMISYVNLDHDIISMRTDCVMLGELKKWTTRSCREFTISLKIETKI